MPLSQSEFPIEVQVAFFVFDLLSDVWEGMSGTYMGKDWSGLKFSYLEEFLLVDISDYDPNDTLPYTHDNAMLLMKNSNEFDTWVTDVVGDLENFTGNK